MRISFSGSALPIVPAPNTGLGGPGVTLVLNEQTVTASGVEVNAVHLVFQFEGEDIVVGACRMRRHRVEHLGRSGCRRHVSRRRWKGRRRHDSGQRDEAR
jgi:hypothetical protein